MRKLIPHVIIIETRLSNRFGGQERTDDPLENIHNHDMPIVDKRGLVA